MTEVPGEVPEFDFTCEEQGYYDHRRIAEQVVWPLVSRHWRGNWLERSLPSDTVEIRKGGHYKEMLIDVTLSAYNDLLKGDEDPVGDNPTISTVSLDIDSIVQDERRGYVLSLAAQGEPKINKHNKADFIVKVGSSYIFDEDGNLELSRSHVVEDIYGDSIWHAESSGHIDEQDGADTEAPLEFEPRIIGHDIEILEAGIYVLDATQAIKKALARIKEQPVFTY